MQEIILKSKINRIVQANNGDASLPLFSPVPFSKVGYRVISEYREINNLTAIIWIQNIEGVDFPTFALETTDSERDLFLLNLQWTSPRLHLNLYLNTQIIETFSMLSPKPYPYGKVDMGNHSLDSQSSLYVSAQDVGYGLLTGQDKIHVIGDMTHHVWLEKIGYGISSATLSLNPSWLQLLPENLNRQGFIIVNSSDNNIYIDINNSVSITSYMVKIPPEGYYESPYEIKSKIYGVSDGENSLVQVREF